MTEENYSSSLSKIALQKFRKNIWGVFSFYYIVTIILISFFAYFLIPDKTENANNGDLLIKSKPPGFTIKTIKITTDSVTTSWKDYFVGKKQDAVYYPIRFYTVKENTIKFELFNNNKNIRVIKNHLVTGDLDTFIKEK